MALVDCRLKVGPTLARLSVPRAINPAPHPKGDSVTIDMLLNRVLVICVCWSPMTWLIPASGPARAPAHRQVGEPDVRLWQAPPVPTVEDAVRMVRIQSSSAAIDGSVGAFSPDGAKFAAILWRGDPSRNVNVYSLVLFDMGAAMARIAPPVLLLSRDFTGDPLNQFASPIGHITFLADNRTLAFIGRDGDAPAQVYTVDSVTRQVRQRTRHPSAVRALYSIRTVPCARSRPLRRIRAKRSGARRWRTMASLRGIPPCSLIDAGS